MSLVLPPEDDTFKCLAVRHVHRAEARAERCEDLLEGDVVYQIKRGQPRRLSREALQFRVFAQVYRCKTAALYEAEYRQFGILAQVKGRDAGVTYIEIGQFGQGRETCRGDACVVADIQVGDVHAVLQSGKVGNAAAGGILKEERRLWNHRNAYLLLKRAKIAIFPEIYYDRNIAIYSGRYCMASLQKRLLLQSTVAFEILEGSLARA